jgi:hypothetical protein
VEAAEGDLMVQRAVLKIHVVPRNASYDIELSAGDSTLASYPDVGDWISLLSLRERTWQTFNDLRNAVSAEHHGGPVGVERGALTDKIVARALFALHARGREIYGKLFGYAYREGARLISGLLNDYVGPKVAPGRFAPLVEINSSLSAALPWQILPLVDPSPPDSTDVMVMARSFAGYSCVLSVRDARPMSASKDIGVRGGLRIGFFRNAETHGSDRDHEVLKRLGKGVRISFVAPRAKDNAQTTAWALANHLLGRKRVDIEHLACEGDTSSIDSNNHKLILQRTEHSAQVSVTVADLYQHKDVLVEDSGPGPLTFLNACGTGAVDLRWSSSLVKAFLDSESRAVAGTETRVPGDFAADFVGAFYHHINAGVTVAEALRASRVDLLARARSPLGLMYNLHGDPDLRRVGSVRTRKAGH